MVHTAVMRSSIGRAVPQDLATGVASRSDGGTTHEGENHRTGWTVYVVPCWRLDGWGRTTISLARLDRWNVERVNARDLPAAVTAAALRPSNYHEIIRNDQLRRRRVASRQPPL
jgi:hypothetical protein